MDFAGRAVWETTLHRHQTYLSKVKTLTVSHGTVVCTSVSCQLASAPAARGELFYMLQEANTLLTLSWIEKLDHGIPSKKGRTQCKELQLYAESEEKCQ